jgi:hypothetical protein
MLEDREEQASVGPARLDAEKLEVLRRWGEGLRELDGEEFAAAGRAILLLLDEIDRLHIELWHGKHESSAEPEKSASDTSLSTTLRDRLRWRLGRANDPLSAALPESMEKDNEERASLFAPQEGELTHPPIAPDRERHEECDDSHDPRERARE